MTTPRVIDPRSTANASLPVTEQSDLLVVGAGPAGLAAAIAAARAGLSVVVVDENPVPQETMGDDVPLHFGQRMSGAVRNRNAMIAALVASEPLLAEAFEAGVDVRLGVIVWGLFGNGPSVDWLPGKVAGLADSETSWMLGFKAAVVAAGRRDMGLAFPGWHFAGVMGATAAERLATRYGALDARRAVVLGSNAEALLAALALHRAGVKIAAIVEQAAAPIGPAGLLDQIADAGIPVLTRRMIAGAAGGIDGVTGAEFVALDIDGRRVPGGRSETIDCDTIVLGIGTVPVIELLDAIGCKCGFSPERGGHVPITDAFGMTSVEAIYAIGDCAGVWGEKSADRAIAEAEGKRAAAHAAARIAGVSSLEQFSIKGPPAATGIGLSEYALAWVRGAVVDATDGQDAGEAHVCQCEEVTAREILEVRPPRYLQWDRPLRNSNDLSALLGNGAPNPDQVKRLTRAGMGLCQGRRCREQVAALMALAAGTGLENIPLATHRAPVRPIPLGLAGKLPETPEMAEHWDVWFGIPGQVTSYWEIDPAAPIGGVS